MTITSRLTLLIWVSVVSFVALFTVFWRTGHWHPHALWGILSVLLTVLPLMLLVLVVLVHLIRGPCRLRSIGWLLVGATPILSFVLYFVSVFEASTNRKPLKLSPALRVTALWASSLMDAEARWRYPRWSRGQHTVLIDAGTPVEDAALTAAMDEHVKAMAKLLGQAVPNAEIAWVRGSLLGQSGRAVGAWSLCGPGSAEVNYVDRHEVAHALISTLAGPDHDPPFVLVEGWAEAQSRERDDLLRYLATQRREGTAMSLQDLLAPDWYSRSEGPVYFVGGPLAIFLMEHYTPQKFFALYANARRPTFREDCRVHLGESWDLVEERFWKWLDEEADRLESARDSSVTFGPDVRPEDWDELFHLVRAARRPQALPGDVAFAIEETWSDGRKQKLHACFEEDNLWMCCGGASEVNRFVLVSDGRCAVREPPVIAPQLPGTVKTGTGPSEAMVYATSYLRECIPLDTMEQLAASFGQGNQVAIRVVKIIPPAEHPQKRWQVDFERFVSGKRFCESSIEIDPNCEYREVRQRTAQTDGWLWQMDCTYALLGGVMLPTEKTTLSIYEGNKVTSKGSLRLLSADEARRLRAEVEQAIDEVPDSQSWQRYAGIVAIGTPLLGILLLFVGAGNRKTPIDGPHDADR